VGALTGTPSNKSSAPTSDQNSDFGVSDMEIQHWFR
jgi:hypothetical protein